MRRIWFTDIAFGMLVEWKRISSTGQEIASLSVCQTVHLQHCLDRLRAGDPTARQALLDSACDRLRELTQNMLRDYRRVRRWEETGDVLQGALLRLCRALDQQTPVSVLHFYRLATLQIRRELIDLARHYYGPEGSGGRHESVTTANIDSAGVAQPAYDRADSTFGPSQLAHWSEFHEQAQALPDEEREVFDLVWYQGLTHAEAAELLGVSTKTIQRRWHAACLRLHDVLEGELPGGRA